MFALREEAFGSYSRTLSIREFNPDTLKLAKRIFADFKLRGVILSDSFGDSVWRLTDEKKVTKLMSFSEPHQAISPWIDCNLDEYNDFLKAYIAFNLGELSPYTLQTVAKALLNLTALDAPSAALLKKYTSHVATFLRMLPGGTCERDWVIEQLLERESKAWSNAGKGVKRVLSDFKSYLRFDDVLRDFWASADSDERLFYFPLYFWWNLTAILPLRVTEFLLTPRDCLNEQNGKNIITVRRCRLKGSGRKIAYRVNEDYDTYEYEIAPFLGYELRDYLSKTNNMEATQLDTLFLTEPHSRFLNDRAAYRNHRYYNYQDICVCMQTFYESIIASSGVEISAIKLGDTRHLAMVNLIISGGSPIICRELAVHADINISSHYYSNISNLVECATLERLRKHKGGSEPDISGQKKYSLSKPVGSHRIGNGYCISTTFQHSDISECLKAVGNDGHIGNCTVCRYYIPDEQGLHFTVRDDSAAREAVDADSHYLMQTIEVVRKGLGYQEDIGSALLRLQHSSFRYYLNIQERFDYGKT
jgi:hypothetical protein